MQLVRPESADAAAAALGNGTKALAGGTDLVPLLRDEIVDAARDDGRNVHERVGAHEAVANERHEIRAAGERARPVAERARGLLEARRLLELHAVARAPLGVRATSLRG